MPPHPQHVDGFLIDASKAFDGEADEYHGYFQVVCSCGGHRLRLLRSNRNSVKGICAACGREITLYDLSYYPAASKTPGEEVFVPLENAGPKSGTPVFVMYEYGPLDGDQEFDPNDITWFQVFVDTGNGGMVKVFDDETA